MADTTGGEGRHDAHRADRDAGAQERDRDHADDPAENAPRDVGLRPHPAEERQRDAQRDEARQRGHCGDHDGAQPTCGEDAQELRRAVDDGPDHGEGGGEHRDPA